jgi:hypothetical protein
VSKEHKRLRRHIYAGQTVTALIHRAIDLGHARLPKLLELTEDDIVEKHKRSHTVPITPQHAKRATPGNACACAIAHAAVELPEVYAALVLRKFAYFLEKDEEGRLKIYRYRSPQQARLHTIKFDKGQRVGRLVVTFGPVPPSAYRTAQAKYNARFYAGRTPRTRRGPTWRPGNYQRTLLPVRLLQPLEQRR